MNIFKTIYGMGCVAGQTFIPFLMIVGECDLQDSWTFTEGYLSELVFWSRIDIFHLLICLNCTLFEPYNWWLGKKGINIYMNTLQKCIYEMACSIFIIFLYEMYFGACIHHVDETLMIDLNFLIYETIDYETILSISKSGIKRYPYINNTTGFTRY